jgi:C1A family cysteine protease
MPVLKKLGWKPDVPDQRDHRFSLPHVSAQALPPKVDLSPKCPPVWDQGNLGSCTAQAIGAAFEFVQMKVKPVWDFKPSALFIYYNERAAEGTINEDAGAMIRTGMKVINQLGACKEILWPYVESKFTKKPTPTAYKNALTHRSTSYERLENDLFYMKSCLASGFPFVYGMAVYESFMSSAVAESGVVPMPSSRERMQGGHAVLCVGYDDETQRFLVRNSWGTSWGQKGYFTIPYVYLTNDNLCADFWTLKGVANP